jgi:hypothetical protein
MNETSHRFPLPNAFERTVPRAIPPSHTPQNPDNTRNDLTRILQTLSSAARNIPSVPELSSAIDRLSDTATRTEVTRINLLPRTIIITIDSNVEQVLTGGHGLLILTKILETVGAIVSKYGPGQTRAVKNLQR